jgi:hypothetical protein
MKHQNIDINTHLIMSSLRLALWLSPQKSCSPNAATPAAAPAKSKKAAVRTSQPAKENVPAAAAPGKETINKPPPREC